MTKTFKHFLNEGILKNKHSGMTDSEALHHIVKHQVKFYDIGKGQTDYHWVASNGKEHADTFHSNGENHAEMIHSHVIPEIKFRDKK